MQMFTFFRPDGSEFRVRADVRFSTPAAPMDYCDVQVANETALRKFTGEEVCGMGRFAPIRQLTVKA